MCPLSPHFIANTDTDGETWSTDIKLEFPKDTLILGSPGSSIAIGDNIYVSDRQSEAICAVGSDGSDAAVSRRGKPQESSHV